MFDDVNDFKTLMVRLAHVKNCPQKFKKIADKKFLKSSGLAFELNKETGWIKSTVSSAARIVCNRLEKIIKDLEPEYKDNFVYNELDNIIDLFGTLIKVPIGQNNFKTETLTDVVQVFLTEWNKIDVWFNFVDDKLNIIKRMFETINKLVEENDDKYVTRNQHEHINHSFKLKLFQIFDDFGDFVNVENLNCGRFLSSILEISNFIEYIVYVEIQRYKKIFNFCLDGWTLFSLIEESIKPKEPFKFKVGDNIVQFDCLLKTTSSFDLKDSDIIETLNLASKVETQISILDNLEMRNFSD
jgi:hypothetical protein